MHHINDNLLIHLHHWFPLDIIILIKDNTYTLFINHQSSINQSIIDINQSILTSINQTIGINDNMIQQSPPLALMAIPTLMSTPIIDVNM
jgi:hypothetical protein